MAKDPAVLFYTSDFLTGTSFLSYEEKGQYITLLCQQHQSNEIPENHMINICGSLDSLVIKKFVKTEKGFYYNERMREEAEKRRSFCDSRSNNKSGRPSKPKKKIIRKSYDNHTNNHMENENDNVDESNNKDAKQCIDYFNLITSSKCRHVNSNINHINARLKEGYSVNDCREVIKKKYKEWKNDKDMAKYITIETLFRSSKFDKYLNQKEKTLSRDEEIKKAIFREE